MKIRMKADISGNRNGQPWPRRGETVDIPKAEAADLCAAGLAEPVADRDGDVEKAVPNDDSEKRSEASQASQQQPEQSGPVTTESAPAVAKKAAPPRKTTAAKPAAKTDGAASSTTGDTKA